MASYKRLTNSSLIDKNKYQKYLTLVLMVFGIFLGIYFDQLFELSTKSFSYLKHEHFKSQHFNLNHLETVTHTHQNENRSLAEILNDATPILCFMIIDNEHHKGHIVAVQDTWGASCSKLIFFSNEEIANLGVIELQIPTENIDFEWSATKEAFKYIYDNNYTNYNWYAKVDINSYVIMENLRFLLYPYPSDQPYYFGNRLKSDVNMHGYMTRSPGFVLSKAALQRFVTIGYSNSTICSNFIKNAREDVLMGNCLENLNVIFGDSRDAHQQLRFLEYPLHEYFYKSNKNLWKNSFYDISNDSNSCSDYLISFPNKNRDPRYNYLLDFYVYHLQIYGISPVMDELPIKLSDTKINDTIAK